jgi:hypothetical protein
LPCHFHVSSGRVNAVDPTPCPLILLSVILLLLWSPSRVYFWCFIFSSISIWSFILTSISLLRFSIFSFFFKKIHNCLWNHLGLFQNSHYMFLTSKLSSCCLSVVTFHLYCEFSWFWYDCGGHFGEFLISLNVYFYFTFCSSSD